MTGAGSHDIAALRRRDLITVSFSTAALAAVPLPAFADADPRDKVIGVQRSAQRELFREQARAQILELLSSEDAPDLMRAVYFDAANFTATSISKLNVLQGVNGFNGSIHFPEELKRPQNAECAAIIKKLAGVREKIKEISYAPDYISWGDLLALSAKTCTALQWRDIKLARGKDELSGKLIAGTMGATWNVDLLRADAEGPDPEGLGPRAGAGPVELAEHLILIGRKGRDPANKSAFTLKDAFLIVASMYKDGEAAEAALAASSPEYAKIKVEYDRSRRSTSRASYEVDFVAAFTKLTTLGSRVNSNAYLRVPEAAAPSA
eukprot:jgi/Mesvir1/18903/Mv18899-RA.1